MKQLAIILLLSSQINCNGNTQRSEPTRIPFRLIGDIIYIQISVNNEDSLNFIFDTGAGMTLIGKPLGDRLGLYNGILANNSGAAGNSTVETFRNNKITIGGKMINNVVLMKDASALNSTVLRENLDGIIGYDILSEFVVKIDYQNSFLELQEFRGYTYSGGGQQFRFRLTHNVPNIPMSLTLNHTKYTGNFLVDSGAAANLVLTTPFAKQITTSPSIKDSYSLSTKIGTSQTKTGLMITRIPLVELGIYRFTHTPVVLSQAKSGVLAMNSFHGVIGNSILKRFDLVLDYKRKTIAMEKNDLFDSEFEVDCLGAIFKKDVSNGKLIISGVIENSPAKLSGLAAGDEIMEIEGVPISKIDSNQLRKILRSDGDIIQLKIKHDKTIIEKTILLEALI